MQITFLGAAGTVTGSKHLLTVNGAQVLLDCGLYQGKRAEAAIRNREFQFNVGALNAMILSHAHIDHSGAIPLLAKAGYRGPIHTQEATVDLCKYMLPDSARIQESDVAFYNKHAARRGAPADAEPLYTEEDALEALKLFEPCRYETPVQVAPGVTATLYDAGHILGSAIVALDIQEDGRKFRLVFSGDLGRRSLPILRDPTFLTDADYLIMESTYGSRVHRPPAEASVELRRVLRETIARGGKVIIPSFAVGRAQDLVYELHQMRLANEIPEVPIFVDSPLAINATEAFRAHPELFDEETQALIRADKHGDALGFSGLKYTRSADESKAINNVKGPAVIISASGMCESGRILHHLRNNIEDGRNTILIVSWQAPETLGRRLAEKSREVRIFGEMFRVRAEVATISGFSGHAGRNMLLEWAGAMKPRLKRVFIVHGEPAESQALADGLKEEGIVDLHIPGMGETVSV
jgi:metallo-beta-lactamase family protein